MRFSSIAGLVAVCCLFTGFIGAQQLPFTHYTPDNEINPLPGNSSTEIYQDRQGYIWLAVYNQSLIRYDGHHFQSYGIEDGLHTLYIWHLQEDREGRLWVGTEHGVAVSERPLTEYGQEGRIRFTSSLGGVNLPQEARTYSKIAVDDLGRIWVTCGVNGVYRYTWDGPDTLRETHFPTDLVKEGANLATQQIFSRRDGSVWVSLDLCYLMTMPSGGEEFETVPDLALEEAIPNAPLTSAFYEDSAGVLWGGQADGKIWRLVETGATRRFEVLELMTGGMVSGLVEIDPGILWISTRGNGIWQFQPENPAVQRHYTRRNGLMERYIWQLLKDREGNIWLAHNAGISKLKANFRAFSRFTGESLDGQPPWLPEPGVTSVLADYRSSQNPLLPRMTLVGTTGGIACIPATGEGEFIQTDDGLNSNVILHLASDSRGRIWATTNKGFNCISFSGAGSVPPGHVALKKFDVFGQPGFVADFPVGQNTFVESCLFPESDEDQQQVEMIWTTGPHGAVCYTGERWLTFGAASGLPKASYRVACSGPDGTVYLGTSSSGLFRSRFPLTRERLHGLNRKSVNVPQFKAFSIVMDDIFEAVPLEWEEAKVSSALSFQFIDGSLWIGTDLGLAVVEIEESGPRIVRMFNEEGGLPADNFVATTVSPDKKTMWGGTSRGLVEVDVVERAIRRTVTKESGLIHESFWGGASGLGLDLDGAVYFSTANGLEVYRPAFDIPNKAVPPLGIRRFVLEEGEGGVNRILLEYAALSFAEEKYIRYKTRLLGYEEDWSPETEENKIRYTNLPAFFLPKTYTFEVLACNNSGIWATSPLTLDFQIKPAWWLTWWAFLSYTCILGLLLASVRHFELRKQVRRAEIERRRRELEEARQLQLSMLPRSVPELPDLNIAVHMKTATEVGGDYYDFSVEENGDLSVAIGDATGHGLQAGTMVTMIKALFTGNSRGVSPSTFLAGTSDAIKRIRLGRLLMALTHLRIRGGHVELSSAGMPPVFVYRKQKNAVEEILFESLPLGAVTGVQYKLITMDLDAGDTLLLLTDGLPELRNRTGELLEYERISDKFRSVGNQNAEDILQSLVRLGEKWTGDGQLEDDITIMIIQAV